MDLKRRELARRLSLRSPMARSASGRPLRTYGRGRGNTAECTQPPTSSTEPAIQGKAGAAGDLDGRDEERCVFDTCRDPRRETRQGGRVPDQRSPGATHLLRLPAEFWEHLHTTASSKARLRRCATVRFLPRGSPSNNTSLAKIFKLVEAAANAWRRLNMCAVSKGMKVSAQATREIGWTMGTV